VSAFSGDWDTLRYNNLLSIPVLVFFSLTIEDWSYESLALNLWVAALASRAWCVA
jgi:hypothetical protein